MNFIEKTITIIEEELQLIKTDALVVPVRGTADAVRVANHFRNKGHEVAISIGHDSFYPLCLVTIKKTTTKIP